jgi:hypothetical protein
MTSKKTKPRKGDEAGGFNPERPQAKKKVGPAIGPPPTDDPYGRARADLKRRIEEVADKWRIAEDKE